MYGLRNRSVSCTNTLTMMNYCRSAIAAISPQSGEELIRWIMNRAIDGVGPLPAAAELANEYKRKSYPSDARRVQALIRWASAKNAATGFLTGLGGALTLPVTIPSSLLSSILLQANLVAAMAEIHGHDSRDDQVRTAVLLCLIGGSMQEVVKQAGIKVGEKVAVEALKKAPSRVLIEINKRVGFRLLTKFGEKGVVNLVKLVPLAGGVIGGTIDGGTCYWVGRQADRMFRPQTIESGSDPKT